MKKFTYSSNNSGGSWWLKDKDWVAMEKAGWYVIWGGYEFCHSRFSFNGKEEPVCSEGSNCPGHRKFENRKDAAKERYLGALAREASKDFESHEAAVAEFERITGQSYTDEGCNCCGEPHHISE